MSQLLNSTNAVTGISKLFSMGVALWQHKRFVATIAAAPERDRFSLLKTYVDGWPDMSFAGFALTLSILFQREKDSRQKDAIQFLVSHLDMVRSSSAEDLKNLESVKQADQSPSNPQSEDDPLLQEDIDFLNDLIVNKPKKSHSEILVDRIMSFNERRYDQFLQNLKTGQAATTQLFENHKKNELNAWGTYFEDRMSYFFARERTGQKDPDFVRVSAQFESTLETVAWAIEMTPRIWETLKRRREN